MARKPSKEYLTLINQFPLVPMRNRQHFKLARKVLDGLLDRYEDLTSEENEYFDVLTDLIYKYEQEHFPIERVSPLEMLKYLMEVNNLRQRDLAHLFSSKSNLSEVLSGRRQISKEQARRLADYFKLSTDAFIGLTSTAQ
jgi:HTH-type transcriptional regulator/antitoxin HigA